MDKSKILVCGDVCGRLDVLEAKVRAVNASHGPLAAVFCVGTFFGPEGDSCLCENYDSTRLTHPGWGLSA